VSISLKGEGKAIVAVDHGSLADKETSDAWKVLLAGLEAKPAS